MAKFCWAQGIPISNWWNWKVSGKDPIIFKEHCTFVKHEIREDAIHLAAAAAHMLGVLHDKGHGRGNTETCAMCGYYSTSLLPVSKYSGSPTY